MSRPCSICIHKDRADIEEAFLAGNSYRNIAERFSLSSAGIHRHKKHIVETLALSQEARDMVRADGLLLQVQDLQARTRNILDAAEDAKDLRTALVAIREARRNAELLAKLTGELQQEGTLVLVAPQWIQLRSIILNTLKPYPAIQAELVGRMTKLEDTGGKCE
jgi:hypothetical protein